MGDTRHLRRAIELALPHRTHPNPRVGAVVVDVAGEVIGEGAHLGPGQDHAEVVALDQAGPRAQGATMYVTLEPCSHHGRTPPCVDAVVNAGVARVVVGVVDPDPKVSGSGIDLLRDAGIEVETGSMQPEVEAVDPGYFRQRRSGLPRIILKYAMTLDGSVAAEDGSSQWITGEEARADAHRLRSEVDAIAVGAGTLRSDDPSLTVRHGRTDHQPRPIVIAGTADLPPDARIWERDPLVIAAVNMALPGGELAVVESEDGMPLPKAAAKELAERGYYDVLLEGGPTIAGAWWQAGIITTGVIYLAGKIGGGKGVGPLGGIFASLSDAADVSITGVRVVGNDVRIDFG